MISRDLWESQGDRRLLRVLDADLASAARRAGGRLACRVGCTECCIGPFPITLLDAHRLAEGLQRLAEQVPARAAAIRKRASAALRILRHGCPGDPATGRLDENETARERFFARHGARPCAALDPKTGACELYEHRPLTCRTYGPLARLDFQDMTGDFADPSLEADIPTDDWPFFYMPAACTRDRTSSWSAWCCCSRRRSSRAS
jgi:Fe-S-cluster containining protein